MMLRLIAAWLLLTPGVAVALEPAVDVPMDEARVLRLGADAGTVIVGNPAVADVTVEGRRVIIVTAKSPGRTNLIVLSADGEQIASTELRVGASGSSHVSVFEGGRRRTLFCAPVCEPAASIGDDAKTFDAAAGAIARREALGQAAARQRTPEDR
ncbi:MAG: pilus assembly protein N-terminal domain-containing protein [Hyphomicrobiales bacterium]|nr:pilus assembly protein N-terminal domain-containing protein [Hyphomicrobiales bacterium]